MATRKKLEIDGSPVLVQSAIEDGAGKNIENTYAKQDGYYAGLTAGLADNLNSRMLLPENSPYLFRTAGGSLEIGNRCNEKSIVGGSVVFNQLVQNGDFANTNNWSTQNSTLSASNNIGTFTASQQYGQIKTFPNLVSGHKYLFLISVKLTTATTSVLASVSISGNYNNYFMTATTNWQRLGGIFTAAASGSSTLMVRDDRSSDWDAIQVRNVVLFDLTQMFGSTIADYINTLETGSAGAGVAWFKRFFSKDYYAYTATPYFINVKTSGKKVVGFNQLDLANLTELVPTGSTGTSGKITNLADNKYISCYAVSNYWNDNQCFVSSMANSITINGILSSYSAGIVKKVLPNTIYYVNHSDLPANVIIRAGLYDFSGNYIDDITVDISDNLITVPEGCGWIIIGFIPTVANYGQFTISDINLNLHWDGERDGEYEPYSSTTYPVSDVELRGIPKLDSDNNLYYDGDVYTPDRTVTRRYKIVNLGDLQWGYGSGTQIFYAPIPDGKAPINTSTLGNARCTNYDVTTYLYALSHDKVLAIDTPIRVIVRDSSYTDAQTFTAAMDGVYLIYELDAPTTENADEYTEKQLVDNWGTEERIDNREIPLLVGHNTEYLPDLKAKVEVAPESPETDGNYAMKRANGENTYVDLSTLTVPLLPSTSGNGTYVLKAIKSGSTITYSWVAETP